MENVKGIIYEPFSPKIGKFKLPDSVINDINFFIDKIDNEKLDDKLDHGPSLAGQVTQEVKLPKEITSKGLLDVLAKAVQAYIYNGIKKEITKFNLIETWVVRQFENEYNPIHWHGGHISGVAYLKLPEKIINNKYKDHIDKSGNIEFIYGSKQFLTNSTFTVKPEIGDLFLFPHYLMHTVYPFYGEGERRSVSFNAMIDENIFFVHNN